MGHDAAVRQALIYLLEAEIADAEPLEQLQAFEKNLDRMTFVPIVTTMKQAPLSMTPEAVHERLAKLDATTDGAVANGFLAYEETVRDAVFFMQRAGCSATSFAQPILERAQEVTGLLLRQAEAVLTSDNGNGWTARRFIAEIIRMRPAYPELIAVLQLSPADFEKRIGSKGNRNG